MGEGQAGWRAGGVGGAGRALNGGRDDGFRPTVATVVAGGEGFGRRSVDRAFPRV